MEKEIWLDCDGTWIDLYGVNNWLNYLLDSDPYPYEKAKPLVNLSWLARTIHELQAKGYKVGIISWLSKGATKEYDEKVTKAKLNWLKKHMPSVTFDKINIVPYGQNKSQFGSGHLFDDEERNRKDWEENGGIAHTEINLIKTLRGLL